MKRLLLSYAIDFAAIFGASCLAYEAGGLGWAVVAAIAVLAYGLWCYVLGMTA